MLLWLVGGQRGNTIISSALVLLSVTCPASHKWIVPFLVMPQCWFLGVWACKCSRTAWAPPTVSPLRLAVSPSAATPTGFYCQRFWACISPCWNPALCGLSHSPVAPLGLASCECGTPWTTSCPISLLFCQPPPCHMSCLPQLPISTLLPVWMNVSCLTPWLFETIQFDILAVLVVFCFKLVVILLLFVHGRKSISPYTSMLSWSPLPVFTIGLFVFLVLSYVSTLQILDIYPLSDVWQICSPIMRVFLLMISFGALTLFSLM